MNKPTSYKLLLPRLPHDLLAGCRPLHVHDWVDFTLGLPLASLGEGAVVEAGLTSAILLGIVGVIFFLTSSLPDGDLLLWTLSAGNLVISNCCKHCFENGMSPSMDMKIVHWPIKHKTSNQPIILIFNYLFLAVKIVPHFPFTFRGLGSSSGLYPTLFEPPSKHPGSALEAA